MLSVIFEVRPHDGQWDAYLSVAKLLRSDLEQVPGFLENVIYKSLTREGWILSLTGLRDERSLVGWLSVMNQRQGEDKARGEILADFRLRAGSVTFDTRVPEGCQVVDQRGSHATGRGTAVTLIEALQWPDWVNSHNPQEIALHLGFDLNSYGDCISWDVFDAIRSPGSIILLASWKDAESALNFAQSAMVPDDARVRAVGVVRDYGMFDQDGVSGDHRTIEDVPRSDRGEKVEGRLQ